MAGPRVFVLYFGASFSDLLNHEVRGMSLDHGFDARLFVAGDQHEARGIRRDPVILRRCELDCLDATRRGALAMEWERLAHTMLPGACLDPLIDGAEHLFVVGRPFREVHSGILPQGPIRSTGRCPAGEGSVMLVANRGKGPLDRCLFLLCGSARAAAITLPGVAPWASSSKSHTGRRGARVRRVSPRRRGRPPPQSALGLQRHRCEPRPVPALRVRLASPGPGCAGEILPRTPVLMDEPELGASELLRLIRR